MEGGRGGARASARASFTSFEERGVPRCLVNFPSVLSFSFRGRAAVKLQSFDIYMPWRVCMYVSGTYKYWPDRKSVV